MTSPALAHALNSIVSDDMLDGAFGLKAFHRHRKDRVIRMMNTFPDVGHKMTELAREVQSRGLDLEGCLIILARAHKENKRSNRVVRIWGSPFLLLNGESIFQLRVALRWMRRNEPARLPEILDLLTTPQFTRVAAAE